MGQQAERRWCAKAIDPLTCLKVKTEGPPLTVLLLGALLAGHPIPKSLPAIMSASSYRGCEKEVIKFAISIDDTRDINMTSAEGSGQ